MKSNAQLKPFECWVRVSLSDVPPAVSPGQLTIGYFEKLLSHVQKLDWRKSRRVAVLTLVVVVRLK